jgi:hypothetical protein
MKLLKKLFTSFLFRKKDNKIKPGTTQVELKQCIICYENTATDCTMCCNQALCDICSVKSRERARRCPHCRKEDIPVAAQPIVVNLNEAFRQSPTIPNQVEPARPHILVLSMNDLSTVTTHYELVNNNGYYTIRPIDNP